MSGRHDLDSTSEARCLLQTNPHRSSISIALRPALAELPALPLHQRPPKTNVKTLAGAIPQTSSSGTLTPPSTPPKAGNERRPVSVDGIDCMLSENIDLSTKQADAIQPHRDQGARMETDNKASESPRLYTGKYSLHEELGHGIWSTVYRASEIVGSMQVSQMLPPSPPNSPANRSPTTNILAVKRPSRRDAHKILEKEAKTLTILHLRREASAYLVPFHGFDAAEHSIVLDALPLSLESRVKSARQLPLSTKTMFDPIIGAEEWANLSASLVDGLAFLHGEGCIHGDIKPGNILLRLDDNSKMTPVYCDFSSSRFLSQTLSTGKVEEVSAVTPDYSSPELLQSFYHRNNEQAIVTFASDIFALGVTLLFAATGESPYAGARMELQKLGMAKEGLPIEYARRGDQASRVMKGRAVAKALSGALAKSVDAREGVEEWKTKVEEVCTSWKEGGWAKGG